MSTQYIRSNEVITLAHPWTQLQEGQVFRVVESSPGETRVELLGEGESINVREALGTMQLGELTVDFDRRNVYRGDESCALSPIEWRLLLALLSRRGAVVDRSALLHDAGLRPDYINPHGALRIWISRLRRKLGEGVVTTIGGQGYGIFI